MIMLTTILRGVCLWALVILAIRDKEPTYAVLALALVVEVGFDRLDDRLVEIRRKLAEIHVTERTRT